MDDYNEEWWTAMDLQGFPTRSHQDFHQNYNSGQKDPLEDARFRREFAA